MYDSRQIRLWLVLFLPLSGCMLFGYELGSDESGRNPMGDGGAKVTPPDGMDDGGTAGMTAGGAGEGGDAGGATPADSGPHAQGSDASTLADAATDAAIPGDAGGGGDPDDLCLGMPNGAACDDGLYCITGEICSGGACVGVPKNCSFVDDACNTGVCGEEDDACILQPVANGTECGSGLVCAEGMCTAAQSCGGPDQTCSLACPGPACSFDCVDAGQCTATCGAGSSCVVDCSGADDCTATCSGADCLVDCTDANNCALTCSGGADCQVDCASANNCDQAICVQGATCALRCGDGNNCEFGVCEGGEQQCDSGVIVCNGDCAAWTWRSSSDGT